MKIALILVFFALTNSSHAAVTKWAEFEIFRDHITVPVKINGIESRAMLDSGANINGLSTRYIQAHGDDLSSSGKMAVKGVFGTAKKRMFSNIDVELWGTSFELDGMVETSLSQGIDALIGSGLFEQFIFQFDFPNSRMRLITRDSLDLRKLKNVKSKKTDGMVMIKVRMNDQKDVWLLLDTGAAMGVVTRRLFAEELGWFDEHEFQTSEGRGVNQSEAMDHFMMPTLEVGPFVIDDVPTYVPSDGRSITFGNRSASNTGSNFRAKAASGVLGYDVLKHFVLTVDYKKGYVHLEAPQ